MERARSTRQRSAPTRTVVPAGVTTSELWCRLHAWRRSKSGEVQRRLSQRGGRLAPGTLMGLNSVGDGHGPEQVPGTRRVVAACRARMPERGAIKLLHKRWRVRTTLDMAADALAVAAVRRRFATGRLRFDWRANPALRVSLHVCFAKYDVAQRAAAREQGALAPSALFHNPKQE